MRKSKLLLEDFPDGRFTFKIDAMKHKIEVIDIDGQSIVLSDCDIFILDGYEWKNLKGFVEAYIQ